MPPELDGAIVSNDFWVYDMDVNIIDPNYFALCVTTPSFIQDSDLISSGTTKRIRAEETQFLCIEIPLPPLEEQRRIVGRIEALAGRVREALSMQEKAVEETDSLIFSAMRQIFKAEGNRSVELQTVCSAIIDNLHSNPIYSDDGNIPCIRSSDVGWGKLFLDTAQKTTEAEYELRTVRGKPTENDVVLVREGGGTGKVAIVEKGQKFSLGQRVMMLRPNLDIVQPKYFLFQMLSPFIYEEQILSLSKGSASPHLNIGSLRNFRFVLHPLDEQRRIVAHLDAMQAKVDELQRLQAETQKEMAALMPSILDRAFKGEL